MSLSRSFFVGLMVTTLIHLSFTSPAQKKGIFDEFYQDDDLDLLEDLPEMLEKNNRDYEIVYDTRQKGDENYRLHIDGVHVVMNSEPQVSSDLLEAIESMYGMGGAGNEEISFIIGGASSTTANKEATTEAVTAIVVSESGNKEDTVKKETEVVKVTAEKVDATTKTAPKSDIASLKRDTDFVKRR